MVDEIDKINLHYSLANNQLIMTSSHFFQWIVDECEPIRRSWRRLPISIINDSGDRHNGLLLYYLPDVRTR